MDTVTHVVADVTVAGDTNPGVGRVHDADIDAVSGIVADRVRPVTGQGHQGRVHVLDIDVYAVTRLAVERAVQRDNRKASSVVVDAVRPECIAVNDIGSLGDHDGAGPGTCGVQSHAIATHVVRGRDRVEAGGHGRTVRGFKIEPVPVIDSDSGVASVVAGRGRVEQHPRERTGTIRLDEDSVRRSRQGSVAIKRGTDGPEVQITARVHLSHHAAQQVAVGRAVIHFHIRFGQHIRRSNTVRDDPQPGTRRIVEVRVVDDAGVEHAVGRNQRIQSISAGSQEACVIQFQCEDTRVGNVGEQPRSPRIVAGGICQIEHDVPRIDQTSHRVRAGIVENGGVGIHDHVGAGTRRTCRQTEVRSATNRGVTGRRPVHRQDHRATAEQTATRIHLDAAGTGHRLATVNEGGTIGQEQICKAAVRGVDDEAAVTRTITDGIVERQKHR